jgi:hypothetical protein
MKFDDFEPGKAYTKTTVDSNKSNSKSREINTRIYVLDINPMNKNILASVGGAPSKWYPPMVYNGWKKKEPSNLQKA